MGLRQPQTIRTQGEHGIFGDEAAAELRADLADLRAQLAEITSQVHSQFTTIAAHAEIARQQADFARGEARADLDRTRDLLIGLIEQVRSEATQPVAFEPLGRIPGPADETSQTRFQAIEVRISQIIDAIDQCFSRQRELAGTMAALLDTVLAERQGEPVTEFTTS